MNFKSLVVVDLETTSLSFPRITEIAMCAVEVTHMDGPQLPRVIHQLSLCVNPMGKIEPVVSNITGLDNVMLSTVNPLNGNAIDCISAFINNIPHPVCFVAHNGIKFDFPILKKEVFSKTKLENLDKVFYVDSVLAFREILCRKVSMRTEKVPPELMDTAEDDLCLLGLECVENSQASQMTPSRVKEKDQSEMEATPNNEVEIDEEELIKAPKKPKRKYSRLFGGPAKRALNFNISEQQAAAAAAPTPCNSSPRTYKLGDIYEFLVGEAMEDSHQAMGDCKALLRCICATRWSFIQYAQQHASHFFDLDQY